MHFAIQKPDTKNYFPIDVSVPLTGSEGASLLLNSQSEADSSSQALSGWLSSQTLHLPLLKVSTHLWYERRVKEAMPCSLEYRA